MSHAHYVRRPNQDWKELSCIDAGRLQVRMDDAPDVHEGTTLAHVNVPHPDCVAHYAELHPEKEE